MLSQGILVRFFMLVYNWCTVYERGFITSADKGRTIRKLIGRVGGGGADEVQKKKSRKGKLNEKKILARQLTLKNVHAMA